MKSYHIVAFVSLSLIAAFGIACTAPGLTINEGMCAKAQCSTDDECSNSNYPPPPCQEWKCTDSFDCDTVGTPKGCLLAVADVGAACVSEPQGCDGICMEQVDGGVACVLAPGCK